MNYCLTQRGGKWGILFPSFVDEVNVSYVGMWIWGTHHRLCVANVLSLGEGLLLERWP
jgi:hypothetical protein